MDISQEGKVTIPFSNECPLEIRFTSFNIHHRITPSYHDFFEITYIFDGQGAFHIEEKKYGAAEGDIFIIGNTEFHWVESYPHSSLRTINLYFFPEFVYNFGQDSFNLEYIRPFLDHSTEFRNKLPSHDFNSKDVFNLIEKIYIEKSSQNDFYQFAVKNYLMEILLLIMRYFRRFASDIGLYTKRRSDIKRLEKVLTYLQVHYNEPISLESAAKIACMSTCYFCKFFKRITGKTFKEFILRLRIDKAKELLLKGDLNITKIAYETGFESHSYFDRIFRRFTNLSPHEYCAALEKTHTICIS
jgi:AraC-like DNA-binding protein